MNFLNNSNYNNILEKGIFTNHSKINVSFEFFPPKLNCINNSNFLSVVKKLNTFNPSFISITCTAKNHIHDITYHTVKKLKNILNVKIAPHLTYINSNIEKMTKLIQDYQEIGIKDFVALRGDVSETYKNKIVYASDLVYLLKKIGNFNIFVAAYPETHPESQNSKLDLINFKKKIECGASKAITQFFFDVNHYLRFRDRCIDSGINIEIIPGILPIINFQQLKKFASMTNVNIPKWIYHILDQVNPDDHNTIKMIGLSIAVDMVNKLYISGVKHFHFYTLNQSDIIYSLCYILGLKPKKIML